jgi:hypothetical protein
MTSSTQFGNGGPAGPAQEQVPRPRASDADREAVVRLLHDAVARGLLTLEEGDERVTAAYTSRFLEDLPPLTADLPPAPASAPVAPGWRALAALAWLQLRTALAGLRRGGALRSRPRLAVVAAVVAVLAVLWLAAAAAGGVGDRSDEVGHVNHVDHVDHWEHFGEG